MSTADQWADAHKYGGGTVQSKAPEREQLQKQMAEYEAKNGPVETSPITSYESSRKRVRRKMGDNLSITRNKGGKTTVTKMTLLQIKTLELLQDSEMTSGEIASALKTTKHNIQYTVGRLVANGYLENVGGGKYRAVDVNNC